MVGGRGGEKRPSVTMIDLIGGRRGA